MTITVDSRADFTLENFRRITVGRESVRIGKVARGRMTAAREGYLRLLEAAGSATERPLGSRSPAPAWWPASSPSA